jgi:hypothetical protein
MCAQAGLAWEGSDLVVMMESAYLPEAENCAAIGFDHVSIHTNEVVCNTIEAIVSGGPVPAAIYAPELSPIAASSPAEPSTEPSSRE